MDNFKIENFCEEHNIEFKKYYNYLKNPLYLLIITKCLTYINHEKIKTKIKSLIKDNHLYIHDKLNKIDIIINFYKQNNLLNKSEIGKFFKYYEDHKKKINIKKDTDLFKFFYIMINYKNLISLLKECFYIFSDYRACIYYMTPSINFYNSDKITLKKVIFSFRDNLSTLNQIISKTYLGEKNRWGSEYYSSAYAMFETLLIIKKYFSNPLKLLKIEFKCNKKCNEKKIIENLCNSYHKITMIDSEVDTKIVKEKINNVSQFIVIIKNLGYDIWFTIPLIFDTIYKNYEIQNISESLTFGSKKIYFQKMNHLIGLMCYILVNNGYITNINIFQKFND